MINKTYGALLSTGKTGQSNVTHMSSMLKVNLKCGTYRRFLNSYATPDQILENKKDQMEENIFEINQNGEFDNGQTDHFIQVEKEKFEFYSQTFDNVTTKNKLSRKIKETADLEFGYRLSENLSRRTSQLRYSQSKSKMTYP